MFTQSVTLSLRPAALATYACALAVDLIYISIYNFTLRALVTLCTHHSHPTQVCEIIDQQCNIDKLQSHMCGLAVIRYIHQMFASRHATRAMGCKIFWTSMLPWSLFSIVWGCTQRNAALYVYNGRNVRKWDIVTMGDATQTLQMFWSHSWEDLLRSVPLSLPMFDQFLNAFGL